MTNHRWPSRDRDHAYRVAVGFVTVALCLLAPSLAAEERILHYRSDIQVHADGWLTVTETLRVRAEGQQIRRGIYRDFPTRYRDRFGNHVRVEFEPVSVLRDGASEAWHSESRSNGVRVYAGSSSRLLEPGVRRFGLIYQPYQFGGFVDV